MWEANTEYRGTSAHYYAQGFSGFKGCLGQYAEPGVWRAPLGAVGANTICSSALGQINPWVTSSAAY